MRRLRPPKPPAAARGIISELWYSVLIIRHGKQNTMYGCDTCVFPLCTLVLKPKFGDYPAAATCSSAERWVMNLFAGLRSGQEWVGWAAADGPAKAVGNGLGLVAAIVNTVCVCVIWSTLTPPPCMHSACGSTLLRCSSDARQTWHHIGQCLASVLPPTAH